jgi:hypothetical protein
MKTHWRRQQVEDLALLTLLDFRRRTGMPLRPPIDVDLVGEIVGELTWDWDHIPEPPQTVIWAGLFPDERRVVLNEAHVDEFRRKPGLERFTKAHELGHWLLHVNHQGEPDTSTPHFWSQQTTNSQQRLWIERHADWFAAALLMPANLFVPATEATDLTNWKALYKLAQQFDVSISALCVRLSTLGLAHVDSNGVIRLAERGAA